MKIRYMSDFHAPDSGNLGARILNRLQNDYKAWYLKLTNYYGDYYTVYVHAPTRSKAKYIGQQCDPGCDFRDSQWTEFTAYREVRMDCVPFTIENFDKAGIFFEFEGEEVREFWNDCPCEICK